MCYALALQPELLDRLEMKGGVLDRTRTEWKTSTRLGNALRDQASSQGIGKQGFHLRRAFATRVVGAQDLLESFVLKNKTEFDATIGRILMDPAGDEKSVHAQDPEIYIACELLGIQIKVIKNHGASKWEWNIYSSSIWKLDDGGERKEQNGIPTVWIFNSGVNDRGARHFEPLIPEDQFQALPHDLKALVRAEDDNGEINYDFWEAANVPPPVIRRPAPAKRSGTPVVRVPLPGSAGSAESAEGAGSAGMPAGQAEPADEFVYLVFSKRRRGGLVIKPGTIYNCWYAIRICWDMNFKLGQRIQRGYAEPLLRDSNLFLDGDDKKYMYTQNKTARCGTNSYRGGRSSAWVTQTKQWFRRGIGGLVCVHGYIASIVDSTDHEKYGLFIQAVEHFRNHLNRRGFENANLRMLTGYDIACLFKKWLLSHMKEHPELMKILDLVAMCSPMLHVYTHAVSCFITTSSRLETGAGYADFEDCERAWSRLLRVIARTIVHCGRRSRLDLLIYATHHVNAETVGHLPKALCRRYARMKKLIRTGANIAQMTNVITPDAMNELTDEQLNGLQLRYIKELGARTDRHLKCRIDGRVRKMMANGVQECKDDELYREFKKYVDANRTIRAHEEIRYIERAAVRLLAETHRQAAELDQLFASVLDTGVDADSAEAARYSSRSHDAEMFMTEAASLFNDAGIIKGLWLVRSADDDARHPTSA